jgi:ribosomal protein S18 acetylase RimI-like enzyme
MQIRKAIVADCLGIARVQVDSHRSAYAGLLPQRYLDQFSYEEEAHDWRTLLSAPTQECLYVAVTEADEVTGYALGRPSQNEDSAYASELVALHVRKAYHRQGIGRRLVAAIANHLYQQGCSSLCLAVLRGNPVSAFYEHLGGQRIGEQQIRLGDEITAVEVVYGWQDITHLCQWVGSGMND